MAWVDGLVAELIEPAGIAGGHVKSIRGIGEGRSLAGGGASQVDVGPVLVNAIDPAPIAGGGQKALRGGAQGVNNVVARRPELARRTLGAQFVYFGAIGNEAIAAGGLHRSGGNDGNGCGGHRDALHRQRRQWALGLFAHRCDVQPAIRGLGQGRYFALGRVVNDQAFAVFADAIDQSPAVGAGDQVSVGLEEEAANMLLVTLEIDLRVRGYLSATSTR